MPRFSLKPPFGTPLDTQVPLSSGLKLLYPLNEYKGDKVFDLYSRKTGTCYTTSWGSQGLIFDKSVTDPYLAVAGISNMNEIFTDEFTFACYFKSLGGPPSEYTGFFGLDTGYNIFALWKNSTGHYFRSYVWGTYIVFTNDIGSLLWTTEPALLVFTCSSTATFRKVYINGNFNEEVSAGHTVGSNTDVLELGHPSTDYPIDGMVYYFAFWNRVLGDSEIKYLWKNPYCMWKKQLPLWLFYADSDGPISASITESAATSESSSATTTFSASINESTSTGESSSASAIRSAATTESVATGESGSAAAIRPAATTESVAIDDSSSAAITAVASTTESAAATESSSAVVIRAASITETANAAEQSSASCTFAASITETTSASEQSSAIATFSVSISESTAASEESSTDGTISASITETTTADDVSSATATFSASINESVAAGEGGSAAAIRPASITESAAISDSSDATVGNFAEITESASITDTPSATVTFQAALSDSVTVSEDYIAMLTANASIVESAGISDQQDVADQTISIEIIEADSKIYRTIEQSSRVTMVLEEDSIING